MKLNLNFYEPDIIVLQAKIPLLGSPPMMKSKMFAVVSLSLFSTLSFAEPISKCQPGVWLDGPKWQDGLFVGSMRASCEISQTRTGELGRLTAYYLAKTKKQTTQVFKGPLADRTLEIPTTYSDQMIESVDGTSRTETRIGDDAKKLFLFSSHSTEINFGGLAQMNRINFDIRVEKLPSGNFKMTLTSYAEIFKTRFIPSGIFFSRAAAQSAAQFETNVQAVAKEVRDNL